MNYYNVSDGEAINQKLLIPVGTIGMMDYSESIDSKELVLSFQIN